MVCGDKLLELERVKQNLRASWGEGLVRVRVRTVCAVLCYVEERSTAVWVELGLALSLRY